MRVKKKNSNRGSALIYVLCIMAVIIVLCLTLLVMSYSLFVSSSKHKNQEQAQILAVTLSKELEDELCYNGQANETLCHWSITYENDRVKNEIYQCTDDGETKEGDKPASQIVTYIAQNIWTNGWTYYNEEERNHSLADATKEFTLSTSNTEFSDTANGITVEMYWESDKDTALREDKMKKNNTLLCITVTSRVGNQSYIVTRNYMLTVAKDKTDENNEVWSWIRSD